MVRNSNASYGNISLRLLKKISFFGENLNQRQLSVVRLQ